MFDVGEETVVAGAIREGLKNVFRAGLQPADLPDEEVVLLIKRGRQEEFFLFFRRPNQESHGGGGLGITERCDQQSAILSDLGGLYADKLNRIYFIGRRERLLFRFDADARF